MSMDNGKLRDLLHTAEEQHRVHAIERSPTSALTSAHANWALITQMARELIMQREDIYGSWEPLERAAHVPHDTMDSYPYKDSTVITMQGHDDLYNQGPR